MHRIGRTGRAGHGGTAVSFCDSNEQESAKAIEKLIARKIPVVEGHPWPMEILEPLPRDKKGRVVNPEDAEARAAAKARRQERTRPTGGRRRPEGKRRAGPPGGRGPALQGQGGTARQGGRAPGADAFRPAHPR